MNESHPSTLDRGSRAGSCAGRRRCAIAQPSAPLLRASLPLLPPTHVLSMNGPPARGPGLCGTRSKELSLQLPRLGAQICAVRYVTLTHDSFPEIPVRVFPFPFHEDVQRSPSLPLMPPYGPNAPHCPPSTIIGFNAVSHRSHSDPLTHRSHCVRKDSDPFIIDADTVGNEHPTMIDLVQRKPSWPTSHRGGSL